MVPGLPTRATLHDAALRHVARYATTQAGLLRVLERRIARWARTAPEGSEENIATAQAAAREVAAQLVAAGAVSDAAFAASRARSLTRAGKSRRAVAAHLAARGVDGETTRTALPEDPAKELAAALLAARRRRIGPFRATAEIDPPGRLKQLAALARAGFTQDIARQALATPRAEAEEILIRFRVD